MIHSYISLKACVLLCLSFESYVYLRADDCLPFELHPRQVGSRVVVQTAGAFMVFLGLFTKFSAVFTTIPIPVIGGVLCCTFGKIWCFLELDT